MEKCTTHNKAGGKWGGLGVVGQMGRVMGRSSSKRRDYYKI